MIDMLECMHACLQPRSMGPSRRTCTRASATAWIAFHACVLLMRAGFGRGVRQGGKTPGSVAQVFSDAIEEDLSVVKGGNFSRRRPRWRGLPLDSSKNAAGHGVGTYYILLGGAGVRGWYMP